MLVLRGGVAALLVSAAAAITALPPWPPTYELAASTITMQCNGSGYSDPTRGAAFGIVSYDWSNDKYDWAKAAPMDCEERLLRQAQMTKRAAGGNNSTHVFVYRNLVKALPWFSSVRKILDDPAYSGFFLKFDPTKKDDELHVPRCAPESPQKCSPFYHDQEQTPEVPTSTSPHPDGSCDPTIGCDCGTQPCGEYLWDHRNGSQLRTWLMDNVIGGPTGLDAPEIDGLFIDDFWCSDMLQNTSCNDPVQGPTEIDSHSQLDMGLSDDDIRDLTLAWRQTMTLAQRTILRKGGYTWSLMSGQSNANAMPTTLSASSCAAQLRDACAGGKAESDWQTQAHIVGFSQNGTALTQVEQDVAFFSLVRGPYAWLGWGTWGMTWPFNREPAHGELPPLPHGVPRPSLLERDFGVPVDRVCREVSPGVFSRRWSLGGDIRLDCNTFEASWGGLSSRPVLDDVAIRAVNENPTL
jgi:hypothetical protein